MKPPFGVNVPTAEGQAEDDVEVVPAPSIAEVDACRVARWRAVPSLDASAFRATTIPLPSEFVDYLLEDGLSLPAGSEAMPARVDPDVGERLESAFSRSDEEEEEEEDHDEARARRDARAIAAGADESFAALRAKFGARDDDDDDYDASSSSSASGDDAVAPARSFPTLERVVRDAVDALGGAVAPKLSWSAPKDATWMATTSTTRCLNPGEVFLLLKASDAVAHDLSDAYSPCRDFDADDAAGLRASQLASLRADATLTLTRWRDLSPSGEFRCFVWRGDLVGACQRDVSNFYPFLQELAEEYAELLATHWQDVVCGHFPSRDYVFDVYVTSNRRVKIIDFNPWGGGTLPLLFEWHELQRRGSGEGGFTDDLEVRVVTSQGHIRPGLRLGVPFDMVDRSPSGAIAAFAERQQREREREAAAAAAREEAAAAVETAAPGGGDDDE